LAKFKVAISFVNYSFEEVIEIEASSIKEASKKCEKIKKDDEKMIKHLESKNVYTSRIIKECRVCKVNWKEDLLRCANFLEKKE
jgi:hypothetical protein